MRTSSSPIDKGNFSLIIEKINIQHSNSLIQHSRLILLRNLKFVGTELKEEEQLLKDSLLRIMASAATVPQTLRDEVVDELENQI